MSNVVWETITTAVIYISETPNLLNFKFIKVGACGHEQGRVAQLVKNNCSESCLMWLLNLVSIDRCDQRPSYTL
jgi:hypothetical protein